MFLHHLTIRTDRFLAFHVAVLHRTPGYWVICGHTPRLEAAGSGSRGPGLGLRLRLRGSDHMVQAADAMHGG